MNKNRINLIQDALRAGVCLFMLSGTCVLSAQTEVEVDEQEAPVAPAKKKAEPAYELKEISGFVYDAATKAPLAGVRIQALNNRFYTALTDETGAYTIKVPEFVTSLYVSLPDYNASQIAIKGATDQNANLYSDVLKGIYTDGTQVYSQAGVTLNNTSATTVEEEIENHLNASVRTINRGGMPAQGAALFMNGLNSLNANAQPLIVIDGVVWDMQYDRVSLHDGFVNNVFSIVDPEDIEEVKVLRNGTALYGARGGNGVILINTKRGRSLVNIKLGDIFSGHYRIKAIMVPNRICKDNIQYNNKGEEVIENPTFDVEILDDKKNVINRKVTVPFERDGETIGVKQDAVSEITLWEDFEFPYSYWGLPDGAESFPILRISMSYAQQTRGKCKALSIHKIILEPVRNLKSEDDE